MKKVVRHYKEGRKHNIEVGNDMCWKVLPELTDAEYKALKELFFSELLKGSPIKCPCCGSERIYPTLAVHCNTCAATSEI